MTRATPEDTGTFAMTDAQRDRIDKLFEEALARPPEQRAAFLEERCEEPDVRQEVASLLEDYEEAADLLDRLADEAVAPMLSGIRGAEASEVGLRSSDPLDLEGTEVGRYAVEEHLGGGGMGVVYRVKDPDLSRQVALKFLPSHLSTHPEAEKRFVREAKAAAALEHPHIATIHEIGETEEGRLFIAMAYYEGETLKEKLAREGPLPIEEALGYAEQIAEALSQAHGVGVVHRDVKPANVMVTGEGEVKLLDFGLAKAAAETRLTDPGQRVGTAAYMSPEQAEGEEVGPKADLWALGALLYEMLAGKRPFQGERKSAIIHSILREEPPALRSHRAGVPAEVEEVVHRCLQKSLEERPSSAEALIEDLESLPTKASPAERPDQERQILRGRGERPAREPLSWLWRFVGELRRRRVLRVAAVYAGTTFVILQFGEILVESYGLPGWTLWLTTLVLLLGIPLAVGLVWTFDMTEEGLVRTAGRDGPPEEKAQEEEPLIPNAARIGLLVVVLVGVGWITWTTGFGPRMKRLPPEVEEGETSAPRAARPEKARQRTPDLDPARVAILYFDDNSPGDTLTAFADGLTEHLIHRLAQVEDLEVVSHHGVRPYREASPSLDSIARSLGAGSLVEGSVKPIDDSLAVFVQLINGANKSHLVSEVVRRPAKEIFALQNEVAQEVSELLRERLGQQVQLNSWRAETDRPEAWRLVQRADRLREDAEQLQQEGNRQTAVTLLTQADSLLSEAESIDPDWSVPDVLRASLAEIRLPPPYGQIQWNQKQRQILHAGIKHAEEALDQDPSNAAARRIRGRLRFWLSRRVENHERTQKLVDRAEEDLRMATREDPGSARAWYALSELLLIGRAEFEQARYYAERARRADAYLRLPAEIQYQFFYAAINEGNFEDAAHWCQQGQTRYPDLVRFRNCELVLLATEGAAAPDVNRAWTLLEEIRTHANFENRERFEAYSFPKIAAVLIRAGQPDSARALLNQARREGLTSETYPLVAYHQAYTHLLLGEEEKALDLLAYFLERAPHFAEMVANDIWFRRLRDRPRFEKLVSRK